MWAIVENNKVIETFNKPKGVVINNYRHSRKIFELWTEDELNSIGIYSIIFDNSKKKNTDFYNNTKQSFKFADNQVTASFGTAKTKSLEDTPAVDKDDNPINDINGNQLYDKGLKTIKKEAISSECYTILEKSDWRVIKAKELGEELDSDWKTFRESVRAKCNSMQSQIDGATSVVKLMELYEYTEQEDGSQTRPLGEFPIKA